MSKKRTQLPPRDSWVEISPGESVYIDAKFQEKWHKETRAFREVRGNFLAACFEIEYLLDSLLSEALFPGLENPDAKPTDNVPLTMESGKVLKNLFDELILKGVSLSPISFGFKIDLFKRLSSQIPALQSNMPEGFGNKLDEVRKIRNRFAHYPITFNPVGDPPDQKLLAKLVCRDKTLILNQDFFDKYSKLFGTVMTGLEEILQKLRENTSRI